MDEGTEPPPGSAGSPRVRSRSRRDKIVAEIQRNRQGGHSVPTWVLAAVLGALILAFVALLILG